MPLYRKKPIIVEAIQYTGQDLPMLEKCWDNNPMNIDSVTILTLEGRLNVSYGDYIIKGIKGEFYPCKPDIFEATYELIGA